MKRLFVTTSIGGLGFFALLLMPLQGCTDLNETPISSITPSNFFHTEGEVLAALAGVYAGSRNSPATLSYVNNVWNTSYAGIARANVLLEALTKSTIADSVKAPIEGEA